MKERGHYTPGVCPGATDNGQTVSIYVDHNHPLLQLKRALPWEALFEVMTRQWRRAGKNIDGRPGLFWDVTLYVPLVVLMLVKHLNARDMESYLAENVVARVFIGRQDDPSPRFGIIPTFCPLAWGADAEADSHIVGQTSGTTCGWLRRTR